MRLAPQRAPAIIGPHPYREGAWILVEADLLARLAKYRQRALTAPESGGLLLGYRRGMHLHVIAATEPGPDDRSSRVSFRRSERGHRDKALAMWRESRGHIDYLGEWHTHPEQHPTPSGTDYRAWAELMSDRPGKPFVFIILGMTTNLWLGCGSGDQMRAVKAAPEANELSSRKTTVG
jgi:integrative and conjugative element protein (TIGR02256 family)